MGWKEYYEKTSTPWLGCGERARVDVTAPEVASPATLHPSSGSAAARLHRDDRHGVAGGPGQRRKVPPPSLDRDAFLHPLSRGFRRQCVTPSSIPVG
jgi:hypothetical protein